MVIEYYRDHCALVAVRIGTIVNGIRSSHGAFPSALSDTPTVHRAKIG
jgi:hypothetical protein